MTSQQVSPSPIPATPLEPATPERPTTRRAAAALAGLWAAVPLYGDVARTRLLGAYLRGGRARRVGVLAAGAAVVGVLLATGRYLPAAAAVALGLPLPLGRLAEWLGRRRGIRLVAALSGPTASLPAAGETLRRMGLDPSRADALLDAASGGTEVLLATFDQFNRVASEVGPIPLFEGWQVAPAEFTPRRRHVLQLVIFQGVVAVKKAYRDRGSLYNEALALHALAPVAGVPKIVSLRGDGRVLYQSFLAGENVGSSMARRGAPVATQHEVDVGYPGSLHWDPSGDLQPERGACLAALATVMDGRSVDALGTLLDRVHRAGVVIRDVKYGNVILLDGRPHLCDFDGARVYRRDSLRFLLERERERDKFNYVFDGRLYSEAAFRADLRALADERPDLFGVPAYFGRGYRAGRLATPAGSTEWRLLRRRLPSLRDRSVLDLGTVSAMRPLEMLRAGARRVVALVSDPGLARYVTASHRWTEFVDNRSYDLQLVGGSVRDLGERDLSDYRVATAFGSLHVAAPEDMARITRALARSAEWFVVQADEGATGPQEMRRRASLPFLRALLAENGFPRQRILRFGLAGRPVVLGTVSRASGRGATST